ncbi:MAG: hypothetical protein ACPGXZ_10640 [Saprospiraceae bacterium]
MSMTKNGKLFGLGELLDNIYDYKPPTAKTAKYFKSLYISNPPQELVKSAQYQNRNVSYSAKGKNYEIYCSIKTPKEKPKSIKVTSTLTIDKLIKRFSHVSILCKRNKQRGYFEHGKFKGVTHYDKK